MQHLKYLIARKPRVALVMCIRNEARFLEANLRYHRAVGIERAYVFLDRCTDGSDQIAASLPWVRVIRLDPADTVRFKHVPDLQVVCMDRGLEMARQEGFDWLLALDADEFAVTSPAGQTSWRQPANFRNLLSRVPESTEVVWLRPQELLPTDLDPDAPFWRQQHFLVDKNYRREALDPSDDRVKTWDGFAGHTEGKSIVRTSANVQALGAHRWTRFQNISYPRIPARTDLASIDAGCLLHFLNADWRQWRDKYRKFSHTPDTFRFGGSVGFPKQAWKQAAPKMDDQEAHEYFQRWVAASDETLSRLTAKGVVQKWDLVERVLKRSGSLAAIHRRKQTALPKASTQIESWSLPRELWRDPAEFWRTDCEDGSFVFHVPELARNCLHGVYPAEYDGQRLFCWMQPKARLQLALQPSHYSMLLHLKPNTPRPESVAVTVDGARLPADRCAIAADHILVELSADDFTMRDEHSIAFDFSPLPRDTRRPKRAIGAAVTDISFKIATRHPTAA